MMGLESISNGNFEFCRRATCSRHRLLKPHSFICIQVVQGVYPGVTTCELDELAAQTAAYMATQHRKCGRPYAALWIW